MAACQFLCFTAGMYMRTTNYHLSRVKSKFISLSFDDIPPHALNTFSEHRPPIGSTIPARKTFMPTCTACPAEATSHLEHPILAAQAILGKESTTTSSGTNTLMTGMSMVDWASVHRFRPCLYYLLVVPVIMLSTLSMLLYCKWPLAKQFSDNNAASDHLFWLEAQSFRADCSGIFRGG